MFLIPVLIKICELFLITFCNFCALATLGGNQMASLNRVFIIGNLGADPELRYTPNQVPVVTLNVATTDVRTAPDGQKQEQTEWHRVTVWNKQAENCAKYLAKGRSVFIEGKIQTKSWDDKATGQKRYSTEILAQNVVFLGGPSQARGEAHPQQPMNYSNQFTAGSEANAFNQSYGSAGFEPSMPPVNGNVNTGNVSTPNLDDIPF